jgi:hypothetical protein
MREVDTGGAAPTPPDGEPADVWAVAAIGPGWAPPPSEAELPPVPGRLELYAEAIVFRADDAVDRASGRPVVGVIRPSEVIEVGPLSPGTQITPTELAGAWMPAWQRRLRCPGFALRTAGGGWVFDAPDGKRRAKAVARRYGVAGG